MVTERPPYPNAPIVLVAVEVRYPDISPRVERAWPRLRDELSDVLPLNRSDAFEEQVELSTDRVRRRLQALRQLATRDQRTAVTIAEDRLILETTDYQGFPRLTPLLERLFATVAEQLSPTAIERVGLRYIDEVRLDAAGADAQRDGWSGWISPELLGPAAFDPGLERLQQRDWRARVRFDWDDASLLVLRYGPSRGCEVEPHRIPQRVDEPEKGDPYFLIDLDCYWVKSGVAPPFNPRQVLAYCEHLHEPIRTTFERAITDRLRHEVLMKET